MVTVLCRHSHGHKGAHLTPADTRHCYSAAVAAAAAAATAAAVICAASAIVLTGKLLAGVVADI